MIEMVSTVATKKFKTLSSKDNELNRVQDNISDAMDPLLRDPWANYNILTDIKLTAGIDNQVNHKLGRKLIGWTIVRIRSEANVSDNQDINLSPQLTLILRTSADVVVDIRVF